MGRRTSLCMPSDGHARRRGLHWSRLRRPSIRGALASPRKGDYGVSCHTVLSSPLRGRESQRPRMRVPRRHEMQVALVLRRVRRVALARRRRQGDSESDAIHLVAVTASRCDGGGEKQPTKLAKKGGLIRLHSRGSTLHARPANIVYGASLLSPARSPLHESSVSVRTGEVRPVRRLGLVEEIFTRQVLAEPPGRVGLKEGLLQLVAKPRLWAGRRRRRRHALLRFHVLDLHRASGVTWRHARRVEGDDDDGGVVAAIALLDGAIDQALRRLLLGIGAAALVERTSREACDLL